MLKINYIDTELLRSLKPCQNRLDNWMEHYSTWSGTLIEFLSLKKISCPDKRWVLFRHPALNKKDHIELACRLAESVLHIYESKYPNDERPRKAIIAARSEDKRYYMDTAKAAEVATREAHCASSISSSSDIYAAAHAADAARSACCAADDVAYPPAHSTYAIYAAFCAHSAASAAFPYSAAAAEKAQLKIIIKYLMEINSEPVNKEDKYKRLKALLRYIF